MPNRFLPIQAGTSLSQMTAIITKNFAALDNESVTKAFKGTGGKSVIVEGKLPYSGGYGFLVYDADGVPRILMGIAPDGQIGFWISKVGISVLDAFS